MQNTQPEKCGDPSINPRMTTLISFYGDGADGSSPTLNQWTRLFEQAPESPITLINFFKLRAAADYREIDEPELPEESGGQAMMRYASVSGPALERVGGRFLLTAPFGSSLMGEGESWDMVAIGSYPSRDALLALFEDRDYAAAYAYRRAALERQRVTAVLGG